MRKIILVASAAALMLAAAPAAAGTIPNGSYECWHFSTPVMLLNFTIQPGGRYLDSDNKPGSYAMGAKNRLVFHGAGHDGNYADYTLDHRIPTVTFPVGEGGGDFCQGPKQ